jgi:hypothetical protein
VWWWCGGGVDVDVDSGESESGSVSGSEGRVSGFVRNVFHLPAETARAHRCTCTGAVTDSGRIL